MGRITILQSGLGFVFGLGIVFSLYIDAKAAFICDISCMCVKTKANYFLDIPADVFLLADGSPKSRIRHRFVLQGMIYYSLHIYV